MNSNIIHLSSLSLSDIETGICITYHMNLNHKPHPAAPLPVYCVSSPCGCQFDNNKQQMVIFHCMVSSHCQWRGTRVVSDYGNGGSREERLQYLTWVDAGDGACRSRVIMVGACCHLWVVGSSHEHSFLLLIDNVDCLVYSRILCKAIIIVNLCMLQVVGACGRCDGSGGQSPPLVEGGWWIVVVVPCCVVFVSPSMWHDQMDYWYGWVDCWMEKRIKQTLQAQQRINNAWKMPTTDRELCKLLLCSLLGSKKYGKMYLESLRNGINI